MPLAYPLMGEMPVGGFSPADLLLYVDADRAMRETLEPRRFTAAVARDPDEHPKTRQRAKQALEAAAPIEPATAYTLLATLLDIYDDHQNNPPEHRCYVPEAWAMALQQARDMLAGPGEPDMQPPATSRDRWMYQQGRLAALQEASK